MIKLFARKLPVFGIAAFGLLLIVLISGTLMQSVREIDTEIAQFERFTIDNRPRHLSQMQLEMVRLRDALKLFLAAPTDENMINASFHVELVWSRATTLLSQNYMAQFKRSDPETLELVESIMAELMTYEDRLYEMSVTDSEALLSSVIRWYDAYRVRARDRFDQSFSQYEESAMMMIGEFRQLRFQLITFGAMTVFFLSAVVIALLRSVRLASRADEANRAKGRFLANMSHELRTPLNGLIGSIELMESAKSFDPSLVTAMKNSSEALLAQINDVLDLTRLEDEQLVINAQDTDLYALVQQVRSIFTASAQTKGLELVVTNHFPDDNCHFEIDGERLRQVLLNLVGNALKFTEKGRVELVIRPLNLEGLAIDVVDTGIGIAGQHLSRVFDTFRQAEEDTSRRYGGSGLGLTISRRLVELMEGTITVNSEVGEGSKFSILLPKVKRVHGPEENSTEPTQEAPKTLSGHVLLAEDNLVNQKIGRALLEKLSLTVDVVNNGREAVAACEGKSYDWVLMDIQMPEMDGLTATQTIRRFNKDITIIALTANSLVETRSDAMAAGMNGFLTKPLRLNALRDTLIAFAN